MNSVFYILLILSQFVKPPSDTLIRYGIAFLAFLNPS
jgi:hypothetical protein